MPPGQWNAITDVPGVRVGYATLIRDEPSVVRTGVTAIWPRGRSIWTDAVFAGIHSFNGNGEMTGTAWIDEQGLLASPICITNTHSVGVVRDAIVRLRGAREGAEPWLLPVVAETYDGWLSDAASFPVTAEHAFAALDGGGRGADGRGQCRRRHRHDLPRVQGRHRHGVARRADGGRELYGRRAGAGELWRARTAARRWRAGRARDRPGRRAVASRPAARCGSIIVVLATDAPLLPIQCQRLARRATTGPRLGRRHRLQQQRRHLPRLRHRQSCAARAWRSARCGCCRPTT